MAYFLFNYIRRKIRERKSVIADESHLTPEFVTGQHDKPQKVEDLHGAETSNASQGYSFGDAGTTSAPSATDAEEAARVKAETARRRKYRWKMIVGLILPNFLAAVDTTIVAPAVPIISSHFNHLSGSFNWIVTAYTLTNTTFVPTSGQIADIYGRHAALQFHIFSLLIGSVICAVSVTWGMFLFGRALQGVGASGIQNLTRIVLSDNVGLADNSKNNTIFSLIAGISYAIGPVIGGYLTAANWRYCFVLSVPIAFIAHLLIFFFMRKDLVKGRVSAKAGESNKTGYMSELSTFDWPGMFFFIFGVGLLILAIMWGGTQYRWSSGAVIAPLVIGGLLFISFFIHEYLLEPGRFTARAFPRQVAMIPFRLFKKHDTLLLTAIDFATGISLTSTFYFISIYWEIAEGYTASQGGVQLLYYTPGLGVGVYSAMFLCNIWPRQTFLPLFLGSTIETIGLSLLAWAVASRQRALVNGMLALAGAGTGLRFMPVVLHAAGIWPTRIASIMSLLNFTIPFGGTIGISMMGSVFTNKFNGYLRSIDPGTGNQSFDTHAAPNLNILENLPSAAKEDVHNAAAKAVMWSFITILPFMGLSLFAAILLGNVWIGRPEKKGENGKIAKPAVRGRVLYGVFLSSLITGAVGDDRKELDKEEDVREKEREKASDEERGDKGRPAIVTQPS
ncbi:hypothetical protein K469DRAFT_625598 [Zopfia rhizophila CBS 207.26]|uniref:Major facilitator superfamily (MFS) profile domain-containing protein n=1 Tax=Zopfia rhizophila CBS 207.26 TaxID=1314779 RepID=A0A6A6EHW9_9PEZI|nr:hypothetical protein K469DRAFT_625598 [Zopfia rhizophila CBS 207.26]